MASGAGRPRVIPRAVPAPGAPAQPRRKYHNIVVTEDGRRFDSLAEQARWHELQLLVRAGVVRDVRHHVKYRVRWPGARLLLFTYEADFVYWDEKLGREVVEDVKSPRTQANSTYRLKKRILKDALGIEISEYLVGRKPRSQITRAA